MADEPHWDVHDGDGPHLLLIHGFLSSRAQWRPNIAALSAVCRPVTMELYGHGRSPSPTAADRYQAHHYAAAIDAIREQLGAATWFVCGYSLGAALSIRYALDYPQRLGGHVFTNSTSAFADAKLIASWSDAEPAHRVRAGGTAAVAGLAAHPRHARRLPKPIRAALLEDAELIDPGGVANTLEYTLPTASARDAIRHNQAPTLLVHGRLERRFAAHRAHAAATMPGLTVVDVDAGHAVNLQAADAFNAAATAFITEHR